MTIVATALPAGRQVLEEDKEVQNCQVDIKIAE